MRRILIASCKGGCGKTTLATNLAVYFARRGRHVAVLDCDRQGCTHDWRLTRGAADSAICVLTPNAAGSNPGGPWSLQIPPTTDVLLIDTPAGLRSFQIGELSRRCDTLLVPVLPSLMDLRATRAFLDDMQRLAEVRTGALRVGLVANRVRARTIAARDLHQQLAAQPFPLLATIRDTQAYVLSAALGKGIFDFSTPTTREHQADWQPLLDWLEATPRSASNERLARDPQPQQREVMPC